MEYKKDFDGWNNVKKELEKNNREVFFYEKEIWWCSMGVNVGNESDGKGKNFYRPVLVYKKFNDQTFLAIPLSSVLREDKVRTTFYFDYDLHTAIISQSKVIDRKRLIKRMGVVSDYVFLKIKKKVIALLQ